MKTTGFTIIQITIVLIIILLFIMLSFLITIKIFSDSKKILSKEQIDLIEYVTSVWVTDNEELFTKKGECYYITVGSLKYYGLMNNDIFDYSTIKEIKDLKIKISVTESFYGKPVKFIEVNPDNESIKGCYSIY